MWDQAGSIRASKIYSVTATVVGLALWAFVVWGSCRTMNSNMIFALCSICLVCEALSALYFEVLGAEPCFQYGYQCHWDRGAYYAAAAVLLWMFTAIGFALYQPKLVPVEDDNRNENGQGNGTTADNNNNNNNYNNNNNNATTVPHGTDEQGGVTAATVDASPQSLNDASSEDEERGLGKKKKSSRLEGDTDLESISTADTPFNLSFDNDDDDSGQDGMQQKDKEMNSSDECKK